MAVDPKEVLLDSNKAIMENLTPFGRKLGIVMDDPNGMALYRIKFVDNKQGEVPSELSGRWTTLAQCKNDLHGYLRKVWAFSDAQALKASKPLASTNGSKSATV